MKPIAWIDPNDNMSDPFSWNKTSYHTVPLYTAPQGDGCGNCHACLVGVIENHMPVTSQRMIVCSDCGNKRCPKASNHRHKCTGSNEVGQYGSIYTAPRELSDDFILEHHMGYVSPDGGFYAPDYKTWKEDGFTPVYKEPVLPRELSLMEINEIADECFGTVEYALWKQINNFAEAILKKASEK